MALTADRLLSFFTFPNDWEGHKMDYPVAASTTIYKGGLVGLNASGYLVPYVPMTSGTSIVGGHRFVGVALDHIPRADQTLGTTNGWTNCQVLYEGKVKHALGSFTVADLGKPVYASADDKITLACVGNAYIGNIVGFDAAGQAIIHIDAFKRGGAAPLIHAVTPTIASAAANMVTVIHKSQNANGLIVLSAFGIVVADFSGAVVYTLQDTAGTTLGITITGSTASDAGEIMSTTTDVMTPLKLLAAATDAAMVVVPAGLGVDAKVTTTVATGSARIAVIAMPIA